MKKSFILLLVLVSAVSFMSSCAALNTTVDVLFVVDEDDDGTFEKIIFEQTVDISGKDPSVQTIIDQLAAEQKITIDYTDNSEINAINSYDNKTEEGAIITVYQWTAKINDNEDIKGLWSQALINEGDKVTFKYIVKDYDPSI